jgi:coproporphyrinogen III oxidase
MSEEMSFVNAAQQQALAKWIGGTAKYTLLYRASRDGWSSQVFHEVEATLWQAQHNHNHDDDKRWRLTCGNVV